MWDRRVDVLSVWKYYAAFLVFLGAALLLKDAAFSSVLWREGQPAVSNKAYFYLQYLTCIFVVMITARMFGESFRAPVCEYLKSFPLSTRQVIFYRYVRLFIVLFVPHAAAVAVMFGKVNASISEYLAAFPEYAPFPAVNILIPLTHCAVALNFYIAMTLFLMLLFRDAVIPIVLIMAWCALEAGPLNIIFQRYDMFAGAFGPQDFYSYLPPNILWMLIAQPILLCLVFVFYGKRSFLGAPVQSFRRVFRKHSGLEFAHFDNERRNDYEN